MGCVEAKREAGDEANGWLEKTNLFYEPEEATLGCAADLKPDDIVTWWDSTTAGILEIPMNDRAPLESSHRTVELCDFRAEAVPDSNVDLSGGRRRNEGNISSLFGYFAFRDDGCVP